MWEALPGKLSLCCWVVWHSSSCADCLLLGITDLSCTWLEHQFDFFAWCFQFSHVFLCQLSQQQQDTEQLHLFFLSSNFQSKNHLWSKLLLPSLISWLYPSKGWTKICICVSSQCGRRRQSKEMEWDSQPWISNPARHKGAKGEPCPALSWTGIPGRSSGIYFYGFHGQCYNLKQHLTHLKTYWCNRTRSSCWLPPWP